MLDTNSANVRTSFVFVYPSKDGLCMWDERAILVAMETLDEDIVALIGKNYRTAIIATSKDRTHIFVRQDGRDFELDLWFQHLVSYIVRAIDAINGEYNKMEFLAQVRLDSVLMIEQVRFHTKKYPETPKHDLEYVLIWIDTIIQSFKIELESKLLVNQIETNRNLISTNRVMKWGLWLTAFISGISAGVTVMDYQNNKSKDKSEQNITHKDSTIQSIQTLLSQTNHSVDSLKKVLEHS